MGHGWLFKSKWVSQHMWGAKYSESGLIYQPSWEAGEDIGFSSISWLNGRIRTILPPMPDDALGYLLWGDSVTIHHKDGQETYTKPIPGKVRWPLTR